MLLTQQFDFNPGEALSRQTNGGKHWSLFSSNLFSRTRPTSEETTSGNMRGSSGLLAVHPKLPKPFPSDRVAYAMRLVAWPSKLA